MYLQFETGTREFGVFSGDVTDGVARVEQLGGGGFNEVWLGPLLRAQWEAVFLEFGWGAFGVRSDDGRADLPAGGSPDGAFRTTPSIAWLVGVGTSVELWSDLELILRLNYRIRYYTTRGGEDLDGARVPGAATPTAPLAHGTQDIQPFIGLAWAVDQTVLD